MGSAPEAHPPYARQPMAKNPTPIDHGERFPVDGRLTTVKSIGEGRLLARVEAVYVLRLWSVEPASAKEVRWQHDGPWSPAQGTQRGEEQIHEKWDSLDPFVSGVI